jgi:hypothetical protein
MVSARDRGRRSFSDRLRESDAVRFVGRETLLGEIADLLDAASGTGVVFLHGPPGIGKSALAREAGRRASAVGFAVMHVDAWAQGAGLGRGNNPTPTLVIVDGFAGDGETLREHITTRLHVDDRVLVTSRRSPGAGWALGGWEALTTSLEVPPLDSTEAHELARRLGVADGDTAEVVRYAQGNPAALIVAARHCRAELRTHALEHNPEVARDLLAILLRDEASAVDPEALRVAALLSRVDESVLAAVIGEAAESGMHSLAALTATTLSGNEVALDDHVRSALGVVFAADDPYRERELRRRLADHIHDRVAAGDGSWLTELPELFRDPRLRWGFGVDARRRHRPDRLRPGDADEAAEALGTAQTEWWAGLRRWFDDAPEAVTVVRDRESRLSGFCVMVTPDAAPRWIAEDMVMAPRIEHARERYPGGEVVVWRDAFGCPREPDEDPAGPLIVANHGAIVRAARIDALCTYGTVVEDDAVAAGLAAAYGATPVDELRVVDGERTVECWVLHSGFGGFVGAARAMLYREMGLRPPPPSLDAMCQAVRQALRSFHDPVALASSPLAAGASVAERTASARTLFEEAIAQGFGDSPAHELDRAVLEAGYLTPGATHDAAARSLYIGRSTYFRHLAAAIERIATVLVERSHTAEEQAGD